MNTGSTLGTAILRGAYNALCTFLVVFATNYLALRGDLDRGDSLEVSALVAAIAAMGVLGFRAGIEGRFDAGRSARAAQEPSDVGYIPPHPTP